MALEKKSDRITEKSLIQNLKLKKKIDVMNDQNNNHSYEDAWWLRSIPLLVAAFVQIVIFFLIRNPVIDDVFHLGEYVAAAVSALHNPVGSELPFTIHGALDIWPYLFIDAVSLSKTNMISNALIIAYYVFRVVGIFLALLIALRLVKLFYIDPIVMIPFMIFVGGFGINMRDLFFLLSFYMLTFTVNLARKGGFLAMAFYIVFGVVAAVGVYWSYDRGLAIIACIGCPLLIMAFRYHMAFIAIASFLVAFLTLPFFVPGIGVVHYFENLLMLIRTSENWRYPETNWELLSGIIVINILAVLTGAYIILKNYCINQKSIIVLAMCIATIVYYKLGTNRVDLGHIISAIWMPMLIFGIATPKTDSLRNLSYLVTGVVAVTLAFAAAERSGVILPGPSADDRWDIATTSILLLFISSAFGILAVYWKKAGFFKVATVSHALIATVSAFVLGIFLSHGARALQSPALMSGFVNLPPDIELVNEGMVWLSEEIMESGAECVFDFANMGILNGLTRLPACTRYTYPVYGGAADESIILAQLKAASPPVVLYSSEYWSYAIDGKPMRERFPQIEAFMVENYPEERCSFGHCLRYRPE